MKKQTRRSRHPHPNLQPNLNVKVRQELIDFDYVEKLPEECKDWLNKFSGEYYNGNFKKSKRGKYLKSNLHNGSKARKECYKRNNDRNNDVFSVTKANDMLKTTEIMNEYLGDLSKQQDKDFIEDQMLEALDLRKKRKYSTG